MNRWIGFAVLAAALLPATAWCAGATPSHRQAAKELLQLAGTPNTMNAAATAMVDAQVKANPAIAPYRDVMLAWVRKYITYDAIEPKLIDLYTQSFSEAELRELNAFYKTPVGHKAMQKMPELMQKGAMLGTEIAQQHTAELKKMIADRDAELAKQKKK